MFTENQVKELLQVQRGNCYVAVSKVCDDPKISFQCITAPEPSGGDWVKNGLTRFEMVYRRQHHVFPQREILWSVDENEAIKLFWINKDKEMYELEHVYESH